MRCYAAEHSAQAVSRVRLWRLNNPGRRNAAARGSYRANRSGRLAYLKNWIQLNPEKRKRYVRRWRKSKRQSDPVFKLKDNLRRRLRHALDGRAKSAKTFELLGCSAEFLREHIERQFSAGMTWSNYGKGHDKWNIDHVIPCASFDLSDPAEQKQCFHFTNLRPLWEPQNLFKGAA